MKVIMTYVGTVAGFRSWLKGQRPANVTSIKEYRGKKEQKQWGGKGSR